PMKLLSSLLLALALSSTLALPPCTRKDPCNPEVPKTTIETYTDTVQMTRILTVTEPSLPCDEPVDDTPSNEERLKQLEKELAETLDQINARTTVAPCPAATTVPEGVTVTDATEEVTTPAADTETDTIHQCSCADAASCRKQSQDDMGGCMEECKEHFVSCGEKTSDYLQCFKENTAIIEAENCLFNDTSYCSTGGCTDKTVNVVDWNQYNNISYAPAADSELKNNYLWEQHGAKYTKIQNFFHCTKNCMHKKFHACTETKKCDIQMPSVTEFSSKMQTCLQKNWKIANSMLTTCQCLAWKNGVKEFQGACVIIGNQYYIDRV
ncbi:hypothetical protein PENTCL1PPCAC_19069, partial [Pristionchus entomophagus]